MFRRCIFLVLFIAFCTGASFAQDPFPLAQELITQKTGYTDKKRDLEELRVRAYIPVLLKAVGKGPAWNPQHPNWAATEKRINVEWRKLYADGTATRWQQQVTDFFVRFGNISNPVPASTYFDAKLYMDTIKA